LEIQSISGNTIGFTTPFHIDFKTSFGAQLTRITQSGGPVTPAVKYGGVEDLYVSGGSQGQGNIWFSNAAYCWVKNVESDYQNGKSVSFNLAFRCVLRLVLLRPRSTEFRELEIVVLRHQLAVLRRQIGRPQLTTTDRTACGCQVRTEPPSHDSTGHQEYRQRRHDAPVAPERAHQMTDSRVHDGSVIRSARRASVSRCAISWSPSGLG